MISLKILVALCALAVLVACDKEKEKGMREKIQACSKESGFDMKNMQKSMREKDPNKVSNEYLCFNKCLWEKTGETKDGKIIGTKIRRNRPVMSMLKDVEGYMKCMEAIDPIKTCDDMKKTMKCFNDFDGHFYEDCAKETKIDLEKFFELEHDMMMAQKKGDAKKEIPNEVSCMDKCFFEKKGSITKDGKVVVNRFPGNHVKNKEEYKKCLSELTISKCDDMNKIWDCMKSKP